jgi:hypothetical protein
VPLHFLPVPIAFDERNGAFCLTATDGNGTIDVAIARDVLEALSQQKDLSKDAAMTILVKNQARLLMVADRLHAAAGAQTRELAISAADLTTTTPG